jgi:glutamate---cysteine ligase / carboxylate-amine ligase
MPTEPEFTIGIEEEYLLVDVETCALAEAPEALMADWVEALEGQVSPELLQCQIEVGTRVCATIGEAREDLGRLRRTVAQIAGRHGLAPIAASCHPFSDWKAQNPTQKDRYIGLARDFAGIARRMLICGMHVHVGVEAQDTRIDLVNQLAYFLPHLLALSCSSPYWQGEDTGLSSYRLSVFDNLPRTGLPPRMASWSEFERSVALLVELGLIEDATKIWWDLRPSHRFPTIESRICDVSPRMEDTLTLAALTQSLVRMLWRLSQRNQRWRLYDSFLIAENRWRAQRYGTEGGLIDFGRREIVPLPELVDELLHLVDEDAGWLNASAEVERARSMATSGNSASRQRAVLERAKLDGANHDEALREVVRHLMAEFHDGL